jgi:hypothetical protein
LFSRSRTRRVLAIAVVTAAACALLVTAAPVGAEGISAQVADVTVAEGDGSSPVTLRIELTDAAASTLEIEWYTGANTALPGTWASPGTDFDERWGVVSIPAGERTADVVVDVFGDDDEESTETFDVSFEVGYHEVLDQARVTILDDDAPIVPDLILDDATANEGDGTITFAAHLSQATSRDVTFSYSTADGPRLLDGARHPDDYKVAIGSVTIDPVTTTATIVVPLTDDLLPELTESFRLSVTGVDGAVVVDGVASGTITDDDPVRLDELV